MKNWANHISITKQISNMLFSVSFTLSDTRFEMEDIIMSAFMVGLLLISAEPTWVI